MLACALVLGALLAGNVALAVLLVAALVFVAVAFVNLPLGIALWLPLVFLGAAPGVDAAWHAGAVILTVAWLGLLAARGGTVRAALRAHAPKCAIAALLVGWLALSLAWAENLDVALPLLQAWATSAVVFVVVVTTTATVEDVRRLMAAYIAGTLLSVLVGVVVTDIQGGSPTVDTLGQEEGRLRGALGDPNYLAASIVAALGLVLGLATEPSRRRARIVLLATAGVLVVALIATESRGGLAAAAVMLVSALVIMRRGARPVGMLLLLACVVGLSLVAAPSAWQRLTSTEDEGNGRVGLTTVAGRMVRDNPALGVGLGNFGQHSPRYVLEPGSMKFVDLIAERKLPPHNAYLQMLAETGPVGLLLFVGFGGICLREAWRARRRFQMLRERALAALASAVLVASIGALAASAFLSNGSDVQLWLLLAMGPALAVIARRRAAAPRPAAPLPSWPPGHRPAEGREPSPEPATLG
jgi:putative inorganic carbon (hco3(-)) transporter